MDFKANLNVKRAGLHAILEVLGGVLLRSLTVYTQTSSSPRAQMITVFRSAAVSVHRQ